MEELGKESNGAAGRRAECVVMKFGGTSVEDATAIRRVSQLVKRRLRNRPVIVVVSALSSVTDQLACASNSAVQGKAEFARSLLQTVRQRHQDLAHELVEKEQFECLRAELAGGFDALDNLLEQIGAAREFTTAAQDRFLSMGEILSSKLLHAALLCAGCDVAWVDATECIVTDRLHTRATPLWDETNRRLAAVLLPLLHGGQVPVLGGFIGATIDGTRTTLGRGGSDFTAAIVGAGLQANRIEIWTDVDGVMTTDPNLCPEARRITSMSFNEAAELAYFGAKVLHPATIAPAMQRNIPVWVLNSRNPESGGTEIAAHSSEGGRVKAISAKRGIAVVDVEPLSHSSTGVLREVLRVFERHEHSLDLLSASRGSLSLLLSSTSALPAIAEELRSVAQVRWENHKALVCLVGEKIRRRPQIASQVLRALSDIDLRMICQGASERSIAFLVDESRADEAVRRLHKLLFPVSLRPAVDTTQTACGAAAGSVQ